jgi:hypothetical protein
MTDEEFERAKSKIVGSAKAMAAKLPDPLARERATAPKRPPPPSTPGTGPSGPPVDR